MRKEGDITRARDQSIVVEGERRETKSIKGGANGHWTVLLVNRNKFSTFQISLRLFSSCERTTDVPDVLSSSFGRNSIFITPPSKPPVQESWGKILALSGETFLWSLKSMYVQLYIFMYNVHKRFLIPTCVGIKNSYEYFKTRQLKMFSKQVNDRKGGFGYQFIDFFYDSDSKNIIWTARRLIFCG